MPEASDPERFERLRALTPIEAVRAWLEGEFGFGDEPALIEALRRDPRIALDDEEIVDTICDAMDDELDAKTCFDRLVGTA